MRTAQDGRKQEARPGATGSAPLSSDCGLKTLGCLKTAPLGPAPIQISSVSEARVMRAPPRPQGQDIRTGGPKRARLRGGGNGATAAPDQDQRRSPCPRSGNTARTAAGPRDRGAPGGLTPGSIRVCHPASGLLAIAPVLALRGGNARHGVAPFLPGKVPGSGIGGGREATGGRAESGSPGAWWRRGRAVQEPRSRIGRGIPPTLDLVRPIPTCWASRKRPGALRRPIPHRGSAGKASRTWIATDLPLGS